jgi:hypothetical protein
METRGRPADATRARRDHRSARRDASDAAMGRAGKADRNRPSAAMTTPTAHCFVAGVPRSMYVPSPFHIIQTSDYIVFLHERMAWRIVRWIGAPRLPDRSVYGRAIRWAMGGRHAGCRYNQPQRQDLAQRGGRDCELRRARGGTIHPDGSRYESTTRRQSPIR